MKSLYDKFVHYLYYMVISICISVGIVIIIMGIYFIMSI